MNNMKTNRPSVGLLTWHYYTNYGSMLQAYAMRHIISDLGYNPIFINYRKNYVKQSFLIRFAWLFLYRLPYSFVSKHLKRFFYPCDRFIHAYFKQTNVIKNEEDLKLVTRDIRTFICGSDQIWAPNVFNPVYMLSFVPDESRKISYAASIGLNEIPQDLVTEYQKYISRFDSVSVRESQGKEILDKHCNISANVVLDPTLMVDISQWKEIEIPCTITTPYIFCYFLKTDHQYKEAVQKLAKDYGCDIYGVSDNPLDSGWMRTFTHNEVGPREFLGLINDAKVVVTDSYHGTIFSLLHHKDFITLERFADTDKVCQNSRIYQLVQYFGIADNIVRLQTNSSLSVCHVNYNYFESQLKKLRKSSLEFLKNALK